MKKRIKIGHYILGIVFALMLGLATCQGQTSQAKEHSKLQKEYSFENYQKNRLKEAKATAKAKKKQSAYISREDRINEKIKKYYAKN